MANTNTPFGLKLVKGAAGYDFNGQVSLYSVPDTDDTNAYYLNDAVKLVAGSDDNGVPNVTKAAGTDILLGSIQGILPVNVSPSLEGTTLSLDRTSIPATKTIDYYVLVSDDPTANYVIQDDGITTANLVAASANLNSSLTITNGATVTSNSATVLLSSSFATTNTLNIKLQGLAQIPGNVFGAYAKWACRINQSLVPSSPVGATGV